MNGKLLLIGVVSLPLLFLSGCTDDAALMQKVEAGKAAVVSIQVGPQGSSQIQSRAIDDGVISDMHILIYDSGGRLVSHGYAQSSSITMNTVSGSGYTIYAIANTGDSSLFGGTTASTVDKLKTLTTAALTSVDDIGSGNDIPMSGSLTDVSISGGTVQSITGLNVARMAAKINLSVTATNGFSITGYAIKNLPKRSYYIARPGTNENSADDLATGDDAPFEALNTSVTTTSSISNLIFYMYENRRGDRLSISGSQGDVTNQQQKAQYAPSNATYVEVYATGGGYKVTYRIYLGADNCRNYNVKRNSQYTCNVTITSAKQVDSRVTKLALPSNSYIVAPSSSIAIPVSRANEDGTTRIADVTKGWTAELLWTDNSAGVSSTGTSNIKSVAADLTAGTINVETGSKSGNAVVVARVNGTIVWSWHLWVTDYDPTATSVSYYNGTKTTVFMDRNLGAMNATVNDIGSYGLLYQWGRKDPFPASLATTGNTAALIYNASGTNLTEGSSGTGVKYVSGGTTSNLANSIKNPLSFYFRTSTPNDWIGNKQNNNLWNSTSGSKTVYDPCPYGWRVPTSGTTNASPWYGSASPYKTGVWVATGWNWTNAAYHLGWYPAQGRRFYNVGTFSYVGGRGYYWTATVSNTNAYYFYFSSNSTQVYPSNADYRAYAFGVRCVKE